jgi:hypothetical protein
MAEGRKRRVRPAIGYAVSGPGFYSWQPSRREARAWGRDLAKASPGKVPRVTRRRAR